MVIVTHEMNFATECCDKSFLWIKGYRGGRNAGGKFLHQNMEECRNFWENYRWNNMEIETGNLWREREVPVLKFGL